MITIVIGGPPTAKGRPRITRKGFAYTPAATYEAHGRFAAQQAMNGRPPIAGPVRAEIIVDLPVPTSWSAKRRDAALRGGVRPTTWPDADNYIKAALDAINEIVVINDSQIVCQQAIRQHSAAQDLNRTAVSALRTGEADMNEAEVLAAYSSPGLRRNGLTRAAKRDHLRRINAKINGEKLWSKEEIEKILDELYGPPDGKTEVRLTLYDDKTSAREIAMAVTQRCFCGLPAETAVPIGNVIEWRCAMHAPWVCTNCGPDSDMDAYPAACDSQNEDEES